MVKHVLDLVKAQAFGTAEASVGFNKKFVTKFIGSLHVKKPFGAKILHPNFLYPFRSGGAGNGVKFSRKDSFFSKMRRSM